MEAPKCTAQLNSEYDHQCLLDQMWGIMEPTFAYESQNFHLCYGVSDKIDDPMAQYELFTSDCVTPATPDALFETRSVYGDALNSENGEGDRTVQLGFEINPTEPLSQGSIARVCVTPNQEARDANIFMRHINDFSWSRDNGAIVQQAVVGPNTPAPNGLTFVVCNSGDLVCSISTILQASFYDPAGLVDGTGTGVMQFGQDT